MLGIWIFFIKRKCQICHSILNKNFVGSLYFKLNICSMQCNRKRVDIMSKLECNNKKGVDKMSKLECHNHNKNNVNFKIIKTLKTPKYDGYWKQKTIKHKAECFDCGIKLEVITDFDDYNEVLYCWKI